MLGALSVHEDDALRAMRASLETRRQREMGYVLAVRANHNITTCSGRTVTAAEAAGMIPARTRHRMRTGSGTKGTRHDDWAMLQVASDDTPATGTAPAKLTNAGTPTPRQYHDYNKLQLP